MTREFKKISLGLCLIIRMIHIMPLRMKSPWVSGGGRIANSLAVEGFGKPFQWIEIAVIYNLSLTRAGTEDAGWGHWLPFMPRHSSHLPAPPE